MCRITKGVDSMSRGKPLCTTTPPCSSRNSRLLRRLWSTASANWYGETKHSVAIATESFVKESEHRRIWKKRVLRINTSACSNRFIFLYLNHRPHKSPIPMTKNATANTIKANINTANSRNQPSIVRHTKCLFQMPLFKPRSVQISVQTQLLRQNMCWTDRTANLTLSPVYRRSYLTA